MSIFMQVNLSKVDLLNWHVICIFCNNLQKREGYLYALWKFSHRHRYLRQFHQNKCQQLVGHIYPLRRTSEIRFYRQSD